MRRYIPLRDEPLLHRFVQGTLDVTCALCVTSTTTLIIMNGLQGAPRFAQILMPIIDAGAALMLGYSLGQRETERLIRKAEQARQPPGNALHPAP